jgi:hypothetical protein
LSQPIKLLFDECLGKPLLADVARLLEWDEPKPTIQHLLEYFESGTCDSVWIPKIANDGWVILTSDRGKKGQVKLPAICRAYKITHILMGPSILKLKQVEKASVILAVWHDIKRCADAPQGSRYLLRLNTQGRAVLKVESDAQIPEAAEEPKNPPV